MPSDTPSASRVAALVDTLGMSPHPEGGHYVEVLRTEARVTPSDRAVTRSAMTHIYYLLGEGEFSAFHRVSSDELWHHYEGSPLTLYLLSPDCEQHIKVRLGSLRQGRNQCTTVPAGWWQAARSRGEYTLCGCTVAPGFDFEDFTMLRDDPRLASRAVMLHPALSDLVDEVVDLDEHDSLVEIE